jgi:hypothetical protein
MKTYGKQVDLLVYGSANFKIALFFFCLLIRLQIVQTDSEVHPTFFPMGTGALSPWVKRTGREVDHSPPTSAEVKKMWIYTSTPPYAFMA